MAVLGAWNGRPISISFKPNCLTIGIETPGDAEVYSYDHAGRLWTALIEGVSYRRGLDGKFIAKRQTPDGGRERRWIVPPEALEIETNARTRLQGLYDALRAGKVSLNGPLPEAAAMALGQALAFDRTRSQADAARYLEVYQPVGILPPDQYMAVVLQAAEGCSFNTCTFCTFYRDRRFRIKTPEAFRTHAEAVRQFLGAGLSLRRTIFLGDANALVIPMPRLLALLDIVHQVYDVDALGGVYAFLDGFSGEKKTSADYRKLAKQGLKRVYIGLESGNASLLQFLHKPGRPEDAIQAVRAMKAGGVAVGVIVLLGAGGQEYAAAHVADTIRTLNAMRLDADDLLYFSELVEAEGMEYTRDAFQARLQPLSAPGRAAQQEQIEAGLKFSAQGGVPHISRYDIREFVY